MNIHKLSRLEDISIEVEKRQLKELNPENFENFLSIKNPSAFVYHGRIGLLYTVRHKSLNGEGAKSYLHLAWSENAKDFRLEKEPFIKLDPDSKEGVEDARIIKIGDTYYITFTAYKGHEHGANTTRAGLITTNNFKRINQRDIILDDKKNNKNTIIFGKDEKNFYVIDRPFNGAPVEGERPSAEIGILSKDLKHYKNLGTLINPLEGKWDAKRVGVNTPPIKTNLGNLFFYHGVKDDRNIYQMGFFISDPEKPKKIIYRSPSPVITPTEDFETGKSSSEVPNVVFGCGAIPLENRHGEQKIRFYYSGADKFPAYADIYINLNGKPLEILDRTFKI